MAFQFIKSLTPFFFDKYTSNNANKNQILDPISTSIKLSLLYYKPQYTRISIDKNRVYLQEPSFYQGIMRNAYGDEGGDIDILICSVENLLTWYNISDTKIRYICNRIINGLEKLNVCYKDNEKKKMVSRGISSFIEKIKREMGELYEPQTDNTTTDTDSILSTDSADSIMTTVSLDDDKKGIYFDYFRNHWSELEILIVYNTLKELERDQNIKKQLSLIKSIEDILYYKDTETHKFIKKLVKY